MKRISQLGIRKLETWISQGLLLIMRRKRGTSAPASPHSPRSVLIVKSCCLGDAVLSLYALREFKQRHPGTRIEMLVSIRIADVYRSLPEIDAVHALPVTGINLLRELLQPSLWVRMLPMLRALRRKQFEWLVDLELYRSFGVVLAHYLGVAHSRGFAVPGAPEKNHDVLAYRGKADPEWKCFYAVLGLPEPKDLPAPLYSFAKQGYPASRSNSITSARRACRIGIVFGASGNWPQKRWPIEYFIALGENLTAAGHELVLFGSAEEKTEGDYLLHALPSAHSTVGQLDFNALIHHLAQCDLIVGNDTGTLHVAAAAGIRVITLFGPTSPAKWNALTSKAVFIEGMSCRPCYYLSSMPACEHRNCLRQLTPQQVTTVVLAELQTFCFLSPPVGATKSDAAMSANVEREF
jgi:ADP-heptose:LPS heptosyltransferase